MSGKPKFSPFRTIWFCLGLLCLALGAVGLVLPLMPTTVFLLIAAFAFARSSDKMHDWLLNQKTFGPLIKDWQSQGAINRKGKWLSVISMVLVVVISIVLKAPLWLILTQTIVLSCVALFLLTRPLPVNEK